MAATLAGRLPRYVSSREATTGVHGLFRYSAKYLPQIARALLEVSAEPGDLVLDPFMGSATTLVEAADLGIRSVGLDLNPLAVLVARAKGATISPAALVEAGARAIARARAGRNPALPEFRNRDYWFHAKALVPLTRLRRALQKEPDPDLQAVLLTVYLSNVKACSNASSYHYKLTRSREPDPVIGTGVYELFEKRVKKAAQRFGAGAPAAGLFPDPRAPARVLFGDARVLPFRDGTFDAVVTHPPYSISFDFVRSFKLYLWWLDAAGDTVALDRAMVGNQRRCVGEPPRIGIKNIDDRVSEIFGKDARDGLAVAHFFADMDRSFQECHRVLKPGGKLAFYVGDSQARWVMLEAPGNLAALAERAGFKLLARVPRDVPSKVASSIRQIHVEEALLFVRTE